MKSLEVVFKIFLCMFTVFLFKRVALAGYGDFGGWGMVPGMMLPGWGGRKGYGCGRN